MPAEPAQVCDFDSRAPQAVCRVRAVGAKYTKSRLPVKLVYVEEFSRIDEAFYREKQIQGWSHKKKKALIDRNQKNLQKYAECKNESHYKNRNK